MSRTQLRCAGLTSRRIDGLVARAELVELMPAVYAPRPVPRSSAQTEWAAALWSAGVLSHRSAARRWRLPVPDPSLVHLTVSDRRFRHPNQQVRLHRVPLSRAETTDADGIPVTSRLRTVTDLLRTEPLADARVLLDRALQQAWLLPEDLFSAFRDGPGRSGNRQLRFLYDELEPGAEAESERCLHRLLRRGGITGWRAQLAITLPGRSIRVDVGFRVERLAIEVDGRRWHDERSERFESDRDRQNDLVLAGWHVLRFTWRMLTTQPDDVIRRIKQELAVLRG